MLLPFAPPSLTPSPRCLPRAPLQVRDLWLPVPTACVAQLAHEEAHGRGAVQLHVRALREALREAGQRQVPHAQKPPGPQARLIHPTTKRPYLFIPSDTMPESAGAGTAAASRQDLGPEGGASAPLQGWALRAGPPDPARVLELAPGAALLGLCQESRTRLKSEKGAALPLGLDDWGKVGPSLSPTWFLPEQDGGRGRCPYTPDSAPALSCQPPLCLGYLGLATLNTPSFDRVRCGRLGALEATEHVPGFRILTPSPNPS